MECVRADDYPTNEVIMQDIWRGICQSEVVIAEMTNLNPNVMYELGISDTYGTPTIIIGQTSETKKLPFDFSHRRVVIYTENCAGREYLLKRFSETLDYVLGKPRDTSKSHRVQAQDSLENHRNVLITEFLKSYDSAYNRLILDTLFFEGFYTSVLNKFSFEAELLEHFQTGHPEIYSALNSVLESENTNLEMANRLSPKIQNRLRNQNQDIHFQSMLIEGKPTFDDYHLIRHIIQKVDVDSTFIARMDSIPYDKKIIYKITSGEENFRLYNADEALAGRLARYLTNLVHDSEIKKEIIAYRDNRTLLDESKSILNQNLGNFLSGVRLQAKKLGGTCFQCATSGVMQA